MIVSERLNERARRQRIRESQAISGLYDGELQPLLHSTKDRRDCVWILGQVGATVGIIGTIIQFVNGNDLAAVLDVVSIGGVVASAWVNDMRVQPRIDLISQEIRLRSKRSMAVLNYPS